MTPARGDKAFHTTALFTAGASTPGSTSGTTGCGCTVIASTEFVVRSNRNEPFTVSRSNEIVSPAYKEGVALILFLVVILFRPEGLLGKVEERKV